MATAWVTISADDLNHYLVAAQTLALRTAALSDGQADPFTEVMPRVVARVRSMIQACESNRVSATPLTVPPSLKDYVCFLILEEMALRIPQLQFTPEQAKMADTARDYLKMIAKCDARIEQPPDPLDPQDVEYNSSIQVVRSSERRATRDTLSGI